MPADPRLTDKEIEVEWTRTAASRSEPPMFLHFARRIERIVAERERRRCADIVERRRQDVLANAADPTWTEHFAEVADTILRDDGAGDDEKGGERG